MKKWRHFRPFVNAEFVAARMWARAASNAYGERPLSGGHSATVTGWKLADSGGNVEWVVSTPCGRSWMTALETLEITFRRVLAAQWQGLRMNVLVGPTFMEPETE